MRREDFEKRAEGHAESRALDFRAMQVCCFSEQRLAKAREIALREVSVRGPPRFQNPSHFLGVRRSSGSATSSGALLVEKTYRHISFSPQVASRTAGYATLVIVFRNSSS